MLALLLFWLHRFFRYYPQRRLDLAQRPGLDGVFHTEYWSRGERVGFLLVALTGLAAFALFEGILNGKHSLGEAPFTFGMGNLAGETTRNFLKSLPPTPERDLYLAMSWQQSDDRAKAEQLYRRLPDFAESWNNLGVILKEEGQDRDAQQAFEKALELDPQLNEAALNLGRKPADLWTAQYGRYFPGRPMLAPPRAKHTETALSGGSLPQTIVRAMAHPFETLELQRQTMDSTAPRTEAVVFLLLVGAFVFAFLSLSVIPYRDVTQPPAKGEWIWATLFPGLASDWGYLAWPVLTAWSYLLIQLFLFRFVGTPYVIEFVGLPNFMRAYGVSAGRMFGELGGLNPGWIAM